MRIHREAEVPVITIDGPSGVGKGTVSHILADKLGWHFLDSGSLYRVMALAVLQHGAKLNDENALRLIAIKLDVHYRSQPGVGSRIYLGTNDITEKIRDEACSAMASKVAALSVVRQALLARQRYFRQSPGLVADGRDMGTIVFQDASLKIYLIATPEIRAKRRFNQLKEKGINVSLEQVLDEQYQRDKRDEDRVVAPMKPAQDAVIIDTTNLTVDEVVSQILLEKTKRNF